MMKHSRGVMDLSKFLRSDEEEEEEGNNDYGVSRNAEGASMILCKIADSTNIL